MPLEQVEARSSLQAGFWFLTPRCQPRGKWRNVVRRELCLQRSTFQVGLIALVLLLVLLAFDLSSKSRGTVGPLDILLFAPFLLATVGTALLAGPTALCEEKALGTAVWSQTLPASVRGQFFI